MGQVEVAVEQREAATACLGVPAEVVGEPWVAV